MMGVYHTLPREQHSALHVHLPQSTGTVATVKAYLQWKHRFWYTHPLLSQYTVWSGLLTNTPCAFGE
jgi:hypothetical protein